MEDNIKLEVILPQKNLYQFLDLIEKHQIIKYSVINNVMGKGEKGLQDGVGIGGTYSNAIVVAVTTIEYVENAKNDILDYMKKHGGIATVSSVKILR